MKEPQRLLATMICRLYGEEKCTHFRIEWTSMVHYVEGKEYIFHQAQIFPINIFEATMRSP
jgi:hypothetical protein